MKKVQLFYHNDLVGLQQKINEWLEKNREIYIEATNITSMGKPSQRAGIMSTEKYVFYILYSEASRSTLTMERVEEEELTQSASIRMTSDGGQAGIHN